jgi:hypothetical protein
VIAAAIAMVIMQITLSLFSRKAMTWSLRANAGDRGVIAAAL